MFLYDIDYQLGGETQRVQILFWKLFHQEITYTPANKYCNIIMENGPFEDVFPITSTYQRIENIDMWFILICDYIWIKWQSPDHIRWILTGPSSELMCFFFDLSMLSSDKEPFDKTWEGPLKFVETSSFSYMFSFQKEKKNWKFQTYWAKGLLNKSLNLYFSH